MADSRTLQAILKTT